MATVVPEWNPANCIQCNQCSLVCPHAAIRPCVMTDEEMKKAPESMKAIDVKMPKELAGMHFRMQVSAMDCTGCGNCADVCPAKEKALVMKPFESQLHEAANWDYAHKFLFTASLSDGHWQSFSYKDNLIDKKANVKNSQFAQPLFELLTAFYSFQGVRSLWHSGACAGCGETPYLKCITQLFGEQMMVANATGCSSIYGGSAPATPYCRNYRSGYGPAWANSLFEDNAEFGLGMATATRQMRDRVERIMKEGLQCDCCSAEIKALFGEWIANRENTLKTKEVADKLIPLMEKCGCDICKQLLELRHSLVKKSQWIFGGDGWGEETSSGCFDSEAENKNIGFGGLDHVLASGEDVNVVVVDTEVYSNTGGQSSKATPAGAVAKFATSGNKIRKKDLGMIAKSYGYVYVAQVAMGASQAQYFNVIKEAEAYHGPSLSLRLNPRNGNFSGLGSQVHWTCSYATLLQSAVRPRTPLKSISNEVSNHGIKIGMGRTQNEEKKAVECGYWHLWHYNPAEEEAGKNGFHLDSKEPDWSKLLTAFNFGIRCSQPRHRDFIMGEVRYNSLMKTFLQEAEELFVATERNAKLRYEGYKKLSEM